MIRHKIMFNLLMIFSLIILTSCGGSSAEASPEDILNSQNSSKENPSTNNENSTSNIDDDVQKAFDEYVPDEEIPDNHSYQNGDLHINELNLEIKKLQAELNHYKANLRELSAKSQVSEVLGLKGFRV